MYVMDTEISRYRGSRIHIQASLLLGTDRSEATLMYHAMHIVIGTR